HEYHRACLKTFKRRLYRSQGVDGVLILPFADLKEAFDKRYINEPNKKAMIWDEQQFFHRQIKVVNNGKYSLSKSLYEKLQISQEDQIFKIPYTTKSYLKYQQYAKIWDLIGYKVHLDALSSTHYESNYAHLNFYLKAPQMKLLYENLRGVYIADNTHYI